MWSSGLVVTLERCSAHVEESFRTVPVAGMGFSVAFYHMGKFVHKPSPRYKGGEVHVFHGLDTDTWSYFEVVGLAKDLGYVDRFNMWWKHKEVAFKRGLRELRNDEDAFELCNIVVSKKCEMEIYLEHGMSREANVKTLKVPLLTDKTETEKVHVNEVVNEDVSCEQLNDVGVDMVNDVVNDMVNQDVGCEQLNDTGVDKVNEVVNEDVGCEQLNDVGVDKVNDVVNEDVGCEQLNDTGVDKVNEVVNEDVGCDQVNDVGDDKVNEVFNDMQAEHGSDVEAESDASEESIRDVHFDDSEEERALGADDGFNYGDVRQAEAELNERLKNMKKGMGGTKERGAKLVECIRVGEMRVLELMLVFFQLKIWRTCTPWKKTMRVKNSLVGLRLVMKKRQDLMLELVNGKLERPGDLSEILLKGMPASSILCYGIIVQN
ncbi:hypothetical protein SESBI_37719 [Sesbania bispinosa]|nr:hypothetical protein SESBI_37719 [Sesbania bispinosa]